MFRNISGNVNQKHTATYRDQPHSNQSHKTRDPGESFIRVLTRGDKISHTLVKYSDDSLKDLLSSELDPLINGEVAVSPGVVLLEESLVLSLNRRLSFGRNKKLPLPQLEWRVRASLAS